MITNCKRVFCEGKMRHKTSIFKPFIYSKTYENSLEEIPLKAISSKA